MQTFHQFDYDTDSFDADAALEFILNHYAFTDIKLRGEAKQHHYISLASDIVDHLKTSHQLRAELKIYKALDPAFTKLSIGALTFGLLSCLPLLYFISTPVLSAHASWLWPGIIVMIGLFIILPVFFLALKSLYNSDVVEDYLTDIHHTELQISSLLNSAGAENSIDMVTMRLDAEYFEAEPLTPISVN